MSGIVKRGAHLHRTRVGVNDTAHGAYHTTLAVFRSVREHQRNGRHLADGSRKFADISNEELSGNFVYAPGNSYGTDYKYSLLRNPHISKNESVQVRPLKDVGYYRNKYFSHLTDVIMVPDNSNIPMRLGGADFDGDMVKTIADRIIISYLYTK